MKPPIPLFLKQFKQPSPNQEPTEMDALHVVCGLYEHNFKITTTPANKMTSVLIQQLNQLERLLTPLGKVTFAYLLSNALLPSIPHLHLVLANWIIKHLTDTNSLAAMAKKYCEEVPPKRQKAKINFLAETAKEKLEDCYESAASARPGP